MRGTFSLHTSSRRPYSCFEIGWIFSHHLLPALALIGSAVCSVRAQDASLFTVGQTEEIDLTDAESRAHSLALYRKALQLEDKGDRDGALKAYREILATGSYSTEVAESAATLLGADGKNGQAIAVLEQAIEDLPGSPDPHLALSRFCLIFGQGDATLQKRAYDVVRKTAKDFPTSLDAIEQTVGFYRARGEADIARTFLLEEALPAAKEAGDGPRLLAIARHAQDLWPVNRSDTREAHLAQLNSFYEAAYDVAGQNQKIRIQVAEYFVHSEQYERARDTYEEILEARPDLLEQRFRLADIRNALKDKDGYLADLEKLVEIDPHNPQTHRTLSDLHLGKGDTELAVKHLRTSLDLATGDLDDYLRLARMLQVHRDYEGVVSNTERAAILFPHSVEARYLGALAKSRLGLHNEAIAAYENTEDMGKDGGMSLNANFQFEFGAAYEQADRFDEAAKKFRKALELVPEEDTTLSARIYNYFGYMWLENDQHIAQAGEMIKRANDLLPDVSAFVDSLGWFYYLTGEVETAELELQRAWTLLQAEVADAESELSAEDAVILEHIARAQAAQGKTTEAIESLKQAIELAPENEEMKIFLKELQYTPKPESSGKE